MVEAAVEGVQKEEVSKKRAVTARWHQRRRVRAATRKKPLFILIKRSHAGEAIEYSSGSEEARERAHIIRRLTQIREALPTHTSRNPVEIQEICQYLLIRISQLNHGTRFAPKQHTHNQQLQCN